MHYVLSIYFSNEPLHVSSSLTAHHHHDVLLCVYSNWYMSCIYDDWLLAGKEWIYSDPANRVIPPDDEL